MLLETPTVFCRLRAFTCHLLACCYISSWRQRQLRNSPAAGWSNLHRCQVKAERDAVCALHAAARGELELLPALARLLDCLVLQSGLALVQSALAGVRAHLEGPTARTEVDILMGREGPFFAPPQEEFIQVGGWAGRPRYGLAALARGLHTSERSGCFHSRMPPIGHFKR